MKNKIIFLYMAIGLSVSLNAEIKISVLGDGTKDIHIVTDGNNVEGTSISTDENGNSNYVYIDKNSQIINSRIGSTVIVNRKFTKEEATAHYQRRINHYEAKIENYHNKIQKYQDKIAEKPRRRERYQARIEKCYTKINEYKNKISKAKSKLQEYQHQ